MSVRYLMDRYRPARAAAGRPDLTIHHLRHTALTLAGQHGATAAELQARAGHASQAAMAIYQHATADRDRHWPSRSDRRTQPGSMVGHIEHVVDLDQWVKELSDLVVALRHGAPSERMEQVRGFFGAGAISAPTRLDFFGGVRPGTPTKDAEAWKKWASDHPFGKIEGDPPNRVGFEAVSEDGIAMQFESPAGLRAWLAAKFPGHKYKSGPVFFHGFLDANALIFPGDTTYRDQIAQVP